MTAIERPELFIGLIGALGTDLSIIIKNLSSEFKRANYTTIEIRFSEIMRELPIVQKMIPKQCPEDERIERFMDIGDKIRQSTSSNDLSARIMIGRVAEERTNLTGAADSPAYNTVYVFNSIKTPEELSLLREVYGEKFMAISIFSPKSERIDSLANRISKSRKKLLSEDYQDRAKSLISRDEKDAANEGGQSVRDVFPLADFFINASITSDLRTETRRIVELLFGNPFVTPRRDEFGMFIAHSSSLLSCDLSRQVGASIHNTFGDIIATGYNDVPIAGGGHYWPDDGIEKDNRDWRIGYDSNVHYRNEAIAELFKLIPKAWMSNAVRNKTPDDFVSAAFYDGDKPPLRGSRLASILEYSRVVHAEMSAITQAARNGSPLIGATLYCTTFPCHLCAKHILASGIARVVFIEPYPKSLAAKLYSNEITDENDGGITTTATHFEPYIGVAPRVFQRIFSMRKRKDALGMRIDWAIEDAGPKVARFSGYIENEAPISSQLAQVPDILRGIENKESSPSGG